MKDDTPFDLCVCGHTRASHGYPEGDKAADGAGSCFAAGAGCSCEGFEWDKSKGRGLGAPAPRRRRRKD